MPTRRYNYEDPRRKVSGIPRMVYSNRRISPLTYHDWFLDETTLRNTNYSTDALAAAFFNDPISFDKTVLF
jgi:hypothetical protein